MSFADWQTEIEETFIQPLQDFRKQVTAFHQVHTDCMNQIGIIMDGLLTGSDGETAFQEIIGVLFHKNKRIRR